MSKFCIAVIPYSTAKYLKSKINPLLNNHLILEPTGESVKHQSCSDSSTGTSPQQNEEPGKPQDRTYKKQSNFKRITVEPERCLLLPRSQLLHSRDFPQKKKNLIGTGKSSYQKPVKCINCLALSQRQSSRMCSRFPTWEG